MLLDDGRYGIELQFHMGNFKFLYLPLNPLLQSPINLGKRHLRAYGLIAYQKERVGAPARCAEVCACAKPVDNFLWIFVQFLSVPEI